MPALPPGPSIAIIQTAKLIRDPYRFHEECRARYGDPYTCPSLNGPVACTGDPDGIREIFSADPDTFSPWAVETMRPILGEGSLLLLSGARHRRERKLLMPAFHGERMRAYGRVMGEVTRRHLALHDDNKEFVFQKTAQAISLEVILRAVFGVEDDAAVERFVAVVHRFVDVASPLVMFTKLLQHEFFGIGPWAKTRRALEAWDDLIGDQIRDRRARSGGEDILGMMLSAQYEDGSPMSDAHVRDELVTLVFAGHETTALALSWAMYWLHRDPVRLERLRAEIDSAAGDPERIAALPFLDAVCNETLRLHPIVPDPLRTVAKPFTLRGFDIPIGAGVAAVSALAHIDPVTWPEPHAFRPERFVDRSYKPWEFLPFGGGARRCIGAAFSVYEMKIALGVALAENEFELCEPGEVKPARRSVTMGPKTGIRIRRVRARTLAART